MTEVSVADAKAKLSELLNRVANGETVSITRRGKAVAVLAPPTEPKRRIDIAALNELTSRMTPQAQSAGEFVRAMRDDDRY